MVLSFHLSKPNPDELSRSQRSVDPAHRVAAQRKSRFYQGIEIGMAAKRRNEFCRFV